jgi:hypothetical protein
MKKKDVFEKCVPCSAVQLSFIVCTRGIRTTEFGQSTEALEDVLLAAVGFDLTVPHDWRKIYLHGLQLLFER